MADVLQENTPNNQVSADTCSHDGGGQDGDLKLRAKYLDPSVSEGRKGPSVKSLHHGNGPLREVILAESLHPGPAVFVSEAHGVELELQDGSLESVVDVPVKISPKLRFVACQLDPPGSDGDETQELFEELLAMPFISCAGGVKFNEDKPAKLRFFVGFVDEFAPPANNSNLNKINNGGGRRVVKNDRAWASVDKASPRAREVLANATKRMASEQPWYETVGLRFDEGAGGAHFATVEDIIAFNVDNGLLSGENQAELYPFLVGFKRLLAVAQGPAVADERVVTLVEFCVGIVVCLLEAASSEALSRAMLKTLRSFLTEMEAVGAFVQNCGTGVHCCRRTVALTDRDLDNVERHELKLKGFLDAVLTGVSSNSYVDSKGVRHRVRGSVDPPVQGSAQPNGGQTEVDRAVSPPRAKTRRDGKRSSSNAPPGPKPDNTADREIGIEKAVYELYRPLRSPDGERDWTVLGSHTVIIRTGLERREVWVESPLTSLSVAANARVPAYSDSRQGYMLYYYGRFSWLRDGSKRTSVKSKVRFGNATKESATFTAWPATDQARAPSENRTRMDIRNNGHKTAAVPGKYDQQPGTTNGVAPQTTTVPAGFFQDFDLMYDLKPRAQMHVKTGVIRGMKEGAEATRSLQLLDLRRVRPNQMLVLRQPRLGQPSTYGKIPWPCSAEEVRSVEAAARVRQRSSGETTAPASTVTTPPAPPVGE